MIPTKKAFGTWLILPFIPILLLFSCSTGPSGKQALTSYVDPFIGTDFHGHVFPGATLPFGMVQLSPDTRTLGWDACAGYHYSDKSILGFSHTHLSGTGIGDYGDVLFQPFTGEVSISAGTADDPDSGFRSRFDRSTEYAQPGYYSVKLTDYDVQVDLTATKRVGLHCYTYPEAEQAGVIIDLTHTIHGHFNPVNELEIVNDMEIRGLKVTRGWAKKHYVYFTAKFDKPFTAELYLDDTLQEGVNKVSGNKAKAKLKFQTEEGEKVLAKVGISPISYEGSQKNLSIEVNGWDFDYVKDKALETWEKQLSLIKVKSDDPAKLRKFYTSLYRSFISPQLYSDVDGTFRTMDFRTEQSETMNYTVYSLWDTYRAFHPLFTIIQPEFNQELIRGLIRKYEEGGILPMWELASNYTGTMIGSHAISVIVDAYMKGHRDFDAEKALEAAIVSVRNDTALVRKFGGATASHSNLMPKAKMLEEKYGFIPCDLEFASVSKALEFAYNYWCIARMAEDMGKEDIAEEYYEKSKRYRTYFDPGTGFMRGKRLDGSWDTPFHPRFSAHWQTPYVEGNAWQWNWYVPHDVDGLAELMGGKEMFALKLDSLFTITSEIIGDEVSGDITGMIGQYAHGNEPSHHIAYLFNEVEMPWRTSEIVTHILDEFYTDQPDGLIGNEDCGQMSAWFLLNSMGLYQVCPGDPRYSIGRPYYDYIEIDMAGDKKFIIEAENLSDENIYVQEVRLDGQKLEKPFILHSDIEDGGTLSFTMGSEKTVFWK